MKPRWILLWSGVMLTLASATATRGAIEWKESAYEILDGDYYGDIIIVSPISGRSTTIEMRGGETWWLSAGHSTTLNMYDGHISILDILHSSSTANLYGGDVDEYWVSLGGTVNLYAYDVTFTSPDSLDFYAGYIQGTWYADNTSFILKLKDVGGIGAPPVFSHINVVPEPGTLVMLAIGAAILRRSRW